MRVLIVGPRPGAQVYSLEQLVKQIAKIFEQPI
jgi:hypothetical protein